MKIQKTVQSTVLADSKAGRGYCGFSKDYADDSSWGWNSRSRTKVPETYWFRILSMVGF